jgi:hypothetical protein
MGKKDKKQKNKSKRQDFFDNAKKNRKGRGKGKTKQSKNWDKYFKEFQEKLQPKGIFMRDVEGDGNCLFRSIADYLEGEENNHEKYRDMAVDYITKNKEYFALFLLDDENIDEYIKDMKDDGTWGGHFELVALSSILRVKFCLHLKDQDAVMVKSSEKSSKGMKIVHLAYHVDEHYSSVRKLGDDEKSPAEDIPLPPELSDSESDIEEDSTEEGSDEISGVTKDVESLYINDRKNKNKNQKEERKTSEEDYKSQKKNKDKEKDKDKEEEEYSKGKGKHQKNQDKKEDKGGSKKKKGKAGRL